MKIALIGATGFVGKAILNELLERNYEVNAIARDTSKISTENGKLQKTQVDVFDEGKLSETIKGSDAIISAYNPGWSNPDIHEEYLKGALAIEKAAEQSGVKKLIVIGGAGTLKLDGNYIVDGPDFPKEIYPGSDFDTINVIRKLKLDFYADYLERNMIDYYKMISYL